jgi:hypothetical protein
MKRRDSAEGLASALASLPSLDRDALKEHWCKLYGREPPANVSRALLIRAVAYRMQENALGGLKPQTRRLLTRPLEEGPIAPVPARLAPGTRLVRAWQGETHQVIVLDDGVLFGSKRYRSLSEVARIITGSRWSGPRFFGLKAGARERGNDRP